MAWFMSRASWLLRNGRWGSVRMLFFLLCLPQKLHTSHLMERAIKMIPFVISWILKTWLVWIRRIPRQVDINRKTTVQTTWRWSKTERHLKALFGSGCHRSFFFFSRSGLNPPRPYIGQRLENWIHIKCCIQGDFYPTEGILSICVHVHSMQTTMYYLIHCLFSSREADTNMC